MRGTENLSPRRPTHTPEYAEACVRALVEQGLGDKISLPRTPLRGVGGALGLLHYLDYRPTHDVDAGWDALATSEERQRVIHTLETTLRSLGQVKTRAWGDLVSVEVASKMIARVSRHAQPI
jgi:hypothetical protein